MSTQWKRFSLFASILIIALSSIISCGTKPTPAQTPTPSTPLESTITPITAQPAPASTSNEVREELKIHFIDVGQGDSILIDLGNTEVLIDGGEKSPGVVNYLRNYVDGPLEVMVATHPHADHIGGLTDVLLTFNVEQVWYNGETSTSKTYADFMSAVNSENAQVHIATRGDLIHADGLSFQVLNPRNLKGTTNNNSIVLHLKYGQVDFLFEGDAEKEAEASMLISPDIPVPDIEILKVGHHGSRTASSPDFLAATTPETAIYMAGVGNTYGHPHKETIQALTAIGVRIYGTDVHGTIIVETDGNKYDVQTEKQAPPITLSVTTPTPSQQ